MIGDSIKQLRIEKGLTQKELADKLFVTSQAVSIWENGEVEPSVSTITEIAKIFGVTSDKILGIESAPAEPVVKKEYVYDEPQKPVLGVCEICNKPIYDSDQIVRSTTGRLHTPHVFCKSCIDKRNKEEKDAKINKSKVRRIESFIFGGIFLVLCIVFGAVNMKNNVDFLILFIVTGILGYTFISCCLFDNNCVREWVFDIFQFGFVKMPGVIFEFSLDGLVALIVVKIFLFVLAILLALAAGALGVIVGAVISLFVFPFALIKNIKNPEAIEWNPYDHIKKEKKA